MRDTRYDPQQPKTSTFRGEHRDVSVIIPTRNRAVALARVLTCLERQDTSAQWEVLVVDNSSSDDTSIVLQQFKEYLPLRFEYEPVPGKSRALNRGMEAATGKMLVFTDDDVTFGPSWISQYVRVEREYPNACVFCGPIIPIYPPQTPPWMPDHLFATGSFARFEVQTGEGLLPPPAVPFGPNFAIRAKMCEGMRFRSDLGPSLLGNFMCEDTEFLRRFRRAKAEFIYVPDAKVQHLIRDELVPESSQCLRWYFIGNGIVNAGEPIRTLRNYSFSAATDINQFERNILLSFYLGQLKALRSLNDTRRSRIISNSIECLGEKVWDRLRQIASRELKLAISELEIELRSSSNASGLR